MKRNYIKLNYIYRYEDLFCWKYAKKGFFNFKKNIPLIIERVIKSKDLFNYDLEFRIQELESRFSKDMSETTFNELKELKNERKIN